MHTDMNVMACLEYAVTALKVKVIICCGHYGCGAVKGALSLPSKTQGLVNCWISDIRECRNQHHAELKALPTQEERVRASRAALPCMCGGARCTGHARNFLARACMLLC
eukprot:363807-Chlamydomonas_euryale.AAC.6